MVKSFRLFTTLFSTILFFSSAIAQSARQRISDYIDQYKELAISEMLRTGVPASVKLAQGLLETAGGQSDLASVANNHFGIKCKAGWTGESMLHDDDAKSECFRKYPSVEDSYKDHSDFLKSRPGYAFLFKLDPTDYEGWAKGLKKAGYATSNTYATALIRTIVENNLQQYTLAGLDRLGMPDNLVAGSLAISEEGRLTTAGAQIISDKPVTQINVALQKAGASQYPLNSVFSINEVKVIYAEAGTSLFALANNHNVSFKKLLEFNDLDQTDIIPLNQLIFLQKKAKKGTRDVHVVEANETLYDIAQKEGMQLSALMELNGLRKDMQPATGEKIYLKFPAPASPRLAGVSVGKLAATM